MISYSELVYGVENSIPGTYTFIPGFLYILHGVITRVE